MRYWIAAWIAVTCFEVAPGLSRAADPGATVFNTYCAMCHQVTGQGVPGQFPRIAGRADQIARSPKGRQYLGTLVLYGMTGRVTIDGTSLLGVMPPLGQLSDRDLADALNHVMHLGKIKVRPFIAADIKSQRRPAPLSPTEVYEIRSQLLSAGAIPP
jgi:cytochrome c5